MVGGAPARLLNVPIVPFGIEIAARDTGEDVVQRCLRPDLSLQCSRRTDLFEEASMQTADAIAQGLDFFHRMGCDENGGAEMVAQIADVIPYRDASHGIE